jgi:hypothetical protein
MTIVNNVTYADIREQPKQFFHKHDTLQYMINHSVSTANMCIGLEIVVKDRCLDVRHFTVSKYLGCEHGLPASALQFLGCVTYSAPYGHCTPFLHAEKEAAFWHPYKITQASLYVGLLKTEQWDQQPLEKLRVSCNPLIW